MNKNRVRYPLLITILIILTGLLLTSCSTVGKAADPSEWGFDSMVTYDALGGVINNRGIRETFYLKNSYLFEPSGTTNMLIEPIRDGYILAGWYTAKEDLLEGGADGTGYAFKPEDRWDFNEDRVQDEDMTLYARWVPQARVNYVDPLTDQVKFSKNITGNDAIKPLSAAAEQLIAVPGMTFDGYYADKALKITYPFNEYIHKDLIPTTRKVYDTLFEMFPQYIEKVEYVKPDEDDLETELDTSDLYINRLGYEIMTDDEAARAEIRVAKDKLYEDAIEYYVANTAGKNIYLKYSEGRYIQVSKASDLNIGGKTGFFNTDKSGNDIDGYIFVNNIDFGGETFSMVESFGGKLVGNGYTLKNIRLNMKTKRMDQDKHKDIAFFLNLEGAEIENLTFENISMEISIASGVTLNAAPIAINASKSKMSNVKLINLNIDTGKGDDGEALYKLGDLFVNEFGVTLENVTGEDIAIKASEFTEIHRLLD